LQKKREEEGNGKNRPTVGPEDLTKKVETSNDKKKRWGEGGYLGWSQKEKGRGKDLKESVKGGGNQSGRGSIRGKEKRA